MKNKIGIAVIAMITVTIFASSCKKVEEPAETEMNIITTTTVTEETTETTVETEPPRQPLVMLDRFTETVAKYPDVAGHITIPNTNVDYDFVQTADNDFYMYRDMDGNDDIHGTIFLDFRCNLNDYNDLQSSNIILHGHNMADLSMFGTLKKYKIKHNDTSGFDFYCKNPTFTFSNLYEEYTYKIFSVFVIEVKPYQTRDGVIFDYHNYVNFVGDFSFDKWIENINLRNEIITDIDVNEDDHFITLNTCSNEFSQSRFVIIARRVRDGESPEVDTSKARLNPDAKEPDWNYIYNAG